MALRSLAESIITLKYLINKDSESLWLAFKLHGIGQAKLVL